MLTQGKHAAKIQGELDGGEARFDRNKQAAGRNQSQCALN